ncbi:MAG: VOC family protein [Deltaproteobacteria bacterium]|nr:VOC family protein [Deltaproteobacteria bacterium]
MPREQLTHHAISYIELSVTDLAEAKRFYGEAFGWSFNDYGPDYSGIKMMSDPSAEVGGLRPVDEVKAGGPLVILFSTDLPATLEKVKAAGGAITVEPFDFPGGRRFHFRDPAGNELAVWAEPAE